MSVKESYAGKINRKLNKKLHVIDVAAGRAPADLVLKNATYVNVFSNELCHGDIAVAEGLIVGMGEYHGKVEVDVSGKLVLPGFIDAHIHLESSLVSPTEFAKAVLPHGTTTVITDPHEIANVMGTDGIEYMLQATEDLPVDVRFMLPSCVPATPLDESGANLDYRAIDSFYDHPRVQGLAEMMNYVGVVNGDGQVVEKIVASQAHHKKIDGHAPGLSGKDLNAYIAAGVYSDHECSDMEDAMNKLRLGQYIMIREGTAARNLEALMPLLTSQYVDRCMFCTDDKHPNDLLEKGHIDYIVKKAISLGADPIVAVKAACHGKLLKVIIETCMLTDAEKIEMCRVVSDSGAEYIKTSTGFGGGGATREDVALFKAHVAPHVKIKAAGGIADLNDARDFVALGADRLGTSRIVKAVKAMEQE